MGVLLSPERFVAQYQKYAGKLPLSYYHNTKLVVYGLTPEAGQMVYFLSYGDIVGENLPWGQAIYHIPTIRQEDARREVRRVAGYFPHQVDERLGKYGRLIGHRMTIFSDRSDERGRPIVEAITDPHGIVERVNFTRRDVVPTLVPGPSENILYLPRRERREPVFI